MDVLNNICEIEQLKKNDMAVLYFTGLDCGACEAIKRKIEEILKGYPMIKSGEVNGEKNVELAVQHDAFSLPLFILYIKGKETLRFGRNIDLMDFERQIERYYTMIFE